MASSLSHDGVLAVELPGAVLGVGHELAGLAVGSDGNARHASAVIAQVGGHGDPVRRAAMGGKEEAFAGGDVGFTPRLAGCAQDQGRSDNKDGNWPDPTGCRDV